MEPGRTRSDGDAYVHARFAEDLSDRIPLLDLRTRLVLLVLTLAFVVLVYLGLQPAAG
jgi:hypothetical protein